MAENIPITVAYGDGIGPEIMDATLSILKEAGGRPHWGKHFSLTRKEVQAMYPDSYDKFCKIRRDLDPKGVFSNTLIHQYFD